MLDHCALERILVEREVLVEFVALALVLLAIEVAICEQAHQPIALRSMRGEPLIEPRAVVAHSALAPAPGVADDRREEAEVFTLGLEAGEEVHEQPVERRLADADGRATVPAPVVAVLLRAALAPGGGQRLAARGALDEAAEREVVVLDDVDLRSAEAGDPRLGALEERLRDQRLEVARDLDAAE